MSSQTLDELSDIAVHTIEDETGTFGTDLGDQTVRLLRVPLSVSLRSLDRHTWGLRLRVAGTFSVHDFKSLGELLDDPSIRAVALVPGVEVVVPLSSTTTLRPFLDVGGGRDTDGRVTAFLGTIGARVESLFLNDPYRFGLEPLLQYNLSSGGQHTHSFASGSIRVIARRALWFTIEDLQPDVGAFVEAGYFYNELEFTAVSGNTLAVRDGFELGVTTGFFYPRPKVWVMTVPRVSLGYRFGELRGIRIRLGGDLLTPR